MGRSEEWMVLGTKRDPDLRSASRHGSGGGYREQQYKVIRTTNLGLGHLLKGGNGRDGRRPRFPAEEENWVGDVVTTISIIPPPPSEPLKPGAKLAERAYSATVSAY